jgi:hypothetical protein
MTPFVSCWTACVDWTFESRLSRILQDVILLLVLRNSSFDTLVLYVHSEERQHSCKLGI